MFIMDLTGSMGIWLNEAKKSVKNIAKVNAANFFIFPLYNRKEKNATVKKEKENRLNAFISV